MIESTRVYTVGYPGLTLILLTWTIWRAPTNASKWRMGFSSVFKGLRHASYSLLYCERGDMGYLYDG